MRDILAVALFLLLIKAVTEPEAIGRWWSRLESGLTQSRAIESGEHHGTQGKE